MCGIIAILARPSARAVPTAAELIGGLDRAVAAADLSTATAAVAEVDRLLHGTPGVRALVGRSDVVAALVARLDQLEARAAERDVVLEADTSLSPDSLEAAAGELIAFRDAIWAVRRDRIRTAHEVEALAGRAAGEAAIAGYLAAQQALSAIDRMEVRGRDSAGIHLYLWDHGLTLRDPAVASILATRATDPLFGNGSVRFVDGVLSVVYKAAAEIGELGDNTAALRAALGEDALVRLALEQPSTRVSVVGHTRWASVGIISEANCHPINSDESEQPGGVDRPYVVAALNGDVDNHADIKVQLGLRIPGSITTDAKVIPTAMAHHAESTGGDLAEAFRRTVASFDGSVAIAASAAQHPDQVYLALRGSGQGIYIGLAEDLFVAASEPYGMVEETVRYLRIDGETPARPDEPQSRGQVVVLDASGAGEIAGIRRFAYDGTELAVGEADIATAEVTTRDIDRGDAPHFLLKEIGEAPESLRKTLRGKIADRDGVLRAVIGDRALPPSVAQRLARGELRRVRVIGQGTAAVAGRSAAAVLDALCDGAFDVDAITATELSGFQLRLDMSDTLVVAISQSGTTTDTNRTVDLVRRRGATVIAIVNRRGSDLTDKADGVLHTSDGRDVEMSVASTKAFYAQVAAGTLLACAITRRCGRRQ